MPIIQQYLFPLLDFAKKNVTMIDVGANQEADINQIKDNHKKDIAGIGKDDNTVLRIAT